MVNMRGPFIVTMSGLATAAYAGETDSEDVWIVNPSRSPRATHSTARRDLPPSRTHEAAA
jgi:hypothetical protein